MSEVFKTIGFLLAAIVVIALVGAFGSAVVLAIGLFTVFGGVALFVAAVAGMIKEYCESNKNTPTEEDQ